MTDRAPVKIVRDQLVLDPVTVNFQRTLRIPETGLHPLPPGLGRFPLRRVADYPDTAPAEWLSRGGVMLPIYQREAMWLSFSTSEPTALQVGVGKVCAVSGLPWIDHLIGDPQNYVALPDQPWLDGINAGDDSSANSLPCRWARAPQSRDRSPGRRPTGESSCARSA